MKEQEDFSERFDLNLLSSPKQSARMYKNHVESLREASDYKKNLQEKLGNITAERDYFEKSATLPIFEQGSPT